MMFACSALTEADVRGKTVIESGAVNVNGSVRPHVELYLGPASYTTTDVRAGDGVDITCDAADLLALLGRADVVIATEMLEHAQDWQAALRGLVDAVADGGLLVLTTRSPGFPYHPHPGDYHRFPVDAMQQIITASGLEAERVEADPDPASPGVFVKARKPAGWSWPEGAARAWDEAAVTPP
jgi:methyltransferase family protein